MKWAALAVPGYVSRLVIHSSQTLWSIYFAVLNNKPGHSKLSPAVLCEITSASTSALWNALMSFLIKATQFFYIFFFLMPERLIKHHLYYNNKYNSVKGRLADWLFGWFFFFLVSKVKHALQLQIQGIWTIISK